MIDSLPPPPPAAPMGQQQQQFPGGQDPNAQYNPNVDFPANPPADQALDSNTVAELVRDLQEASSSGATSLPRAGHCSDHRGAHRRTGPAKLHSESPRAVRRRRGRRRYVRANQYKKRCRSASLANLQLHLRRTADSHFSRHFIFSFSDAYCTSHAV